MWKAQVDALSLTHRVVAPDFPGFGQSAPPRPFTMESAADNVRALAGELLGPHPKFILGGLSMGGYVALAYARRHPKTLAGLMLVDTKAEADTAEGRIGRDKMIALVREKGSAAVGEVMVPKLIAPVKARPQLVKELREMTDASPPAAIENALVAMKGRLDQSPHLPNINVPTLVMVGDVDQLTPVPVAESMQKAIPGAELAIIRGAGHMSPMEQPEQTNAAMKRFVSRL
jgi:pimeloyl-ACP methyl ester carboxylesterase